MADRRDCTDKDAHAHVLIRHWSASYPGIPGVENLRRRAILEWEEGGVPDHRLWARYPIARLSGANDCKRHSGAPRVVAVAWSSDQQEEDHVHSRFALGHTATITEDPLFDEGQVAATAFLARYSGRTLDAYRYDLRTFFQWASDARVAVLEATRPHIELYRISMAQRNLAPSTIDRRLSTVCGFYRFAHIDGRVGANPAQYVRRPKVHPSEGRGLDRRELGTFLFTAERFDQDHAALAVLLGLNGLRVSDACGTNIEDLAFDRGHRTLRIMGKGNKPAVIPLVPRAARTIDMVIGERSDGPILRRQDGSRLDRRTAHRWVRSIGKRAGLGIVYPHMLRSAFIMAALDAGVPLRDVQIAARHADPRTTTIYDRRRENFDRHAAYVVVAFVAGG